MDVGLGILNLKHDELFNLTYYQFVQLYNGWEEREKRNSIQRAEIIVSIFNANRTDEKQKVTRIGDILPWYDEYISGSDEGSTEYLEQRVIDESIPQLERITIRLLEQRGLDPDEVKHDSVEWKESEDLAKKCVTGGRTSEPSEEGVPTDGFVIQKADPKVWGEKPPWEDDE